jgi:ribulose 1,5-bisphosphate synthetase/thiazole synthase
MLRQIFVFLRRLAFISTTGHRAGCVATMKKRMALKDKNARLKFEKAMFEANLNQALTHGSECQAANRN